MSVFDVFHPISNTTPKFTEEQLKEILKWFDDNAQPLLITDKGEPTNVVTIEQLLQFLDLKKFHKRSFHYPTYHEIMTQVENLKADVTRMLTLEQFIYILNLWILHPDIKHELKLAFQVFDTERRNYLEIDEIRAIVKDNADVFNETETLELIRDANVSGSGNVSYEDFVERIFRSAPELYELKADYLYDDPNEDPSIPPDPEPIVEAVAVAKNPSLHIDKNKSRN